MSLSASQAAVLSNSSVPSEEKQTRRHTHMHVHAHFNSLGANIAIPVLEMFYVFIGNAFSHYICQI